MPTSFVRDRISDLDRLYTTTEITEALEILERYDVAYVYAGEVNVNVEMVRLGWSTFWTEYGEGRFAEPFSNAEEQAKAKKRGLWKDS